MSATESNGNQEATFIADEISNVNEVLNRLHRHTNQQYLNRRTIRTALNDIRYGINDIEQCVNDIVAQNTQLREQLAASQKSHNERGAWLDARERAIIDRETRLNATVPMGGHSLAQQPPPSTGNCFNTQPQNSFGPVNTFTYTGYGNWLRPPTPERDAAGFRRIRAERGPSSPTSTFGMPSESIVGPQPWVKRG